MVSPKQTVQLKRGEVVPGLNPNPIPHPHPHPNRDPNPNPSPNLNPNPNPNQVVPGFREGYPADRYYILSLP